MKINIIKDYQKNAASKAKSFHPDFLRQRIPVKKQLIKNHIKETLVNRSQFFESRETIANKFNVRPRYVTDIYKELEDDPIYSVSRKKGFTVQIKFSCLSSSIQSGNNTLINIKRNYINLPSLPLSFPSSFPKEKKVKKVMKVKEGKKRKMSLEMEALPEFKHIIVGEHGLQKLRVYPNEALIHADECLKFAKPYDPVKFFCSVAYKYCLEHKITPQWQIWFDYKEKHNLSENLPFLKLKVSQPQKREMRSMSSPKRVDQSALFKKLQPVYEPREIAERKLYAQDLDPKFIALLGPDLAERCRKSQLERCSF